MKKRTVFLIGLLSFLGCFLLIWQVLIVPQKSSPSSLPFQPTETIKPTNFPTAAPSPSLFPSISPTPFSTPKITIDPLKQKIIELLPIKNEDFTIEYSAVTDSFIVIALHQPIEVCHQKAEQWFREQGVENLEQFNIIWGGVRGAMIE